MQPDQHPTTSPPPPAGSDSVVVLLIDDQAIVGHAVRQMLQPESDIQLHFCQDPTKAVAMANEVAPTVILQDLVMPEIDGLTLLKFFRANSATRETPMIVLSSKEEPTIKAQAFALGANDYLVKLPDRIELVARIRHHSRGYIAQLQRNEAYRKLAESQRQLAEEISQAAKYVKSLLPEPIKEGPVRIDWRFIPSTQLGGDAFGYHWLDPTHLAIYLLDVSGHGVGSSLLAVSVLNVLSQQSLPRTDFYDPAAVMRGLSSVFQMERHGGKYFTLWYGIYDLSTRRLTFSGGGHPPALLLTGASATEAQFRQLQPDGPIIGLGDAIPFDNSTVDLGDFARLLIYSDGAVEIAKPEGEMATYEEFSAFVSQHHARDDLMERVLERVEDPRRQGGSRRRLQPHANRLSAHPLRLAVEYCSARLHHFHTVADSVETLGSPQHKPAAILEEFAQFVAYLPPCRLIEVNEHIAAKDKVESAQAGRRLEQVEPAKLHKSPHRLLEQPVVRATVKMPLQLFLGQSAGHLGLAVAPRLGFLDSIGGDVAGQDAELMLLQIMRTVGLDELPHQHGETVGLLAGGGRSGPDPDAVPLCIGAIQQPDACRQNLLPNGLEK